MANDATDIKLVCVKVLEPASELDKQLAKLRKECDLVRNMPFHAHIVRYLDFYEHTELYNPISCEHVRIYGVVIMPLQPNCDLLD